MQDGKEWPRGKRLANRFVVERRLGAGGMGIVYEVFDERRRELVALKTLERFDGASVWRLKNEFRTLADLVHPNLVRLHELFVDDDSGLFFTMARIEGVPFTKPTRSPEQHRDAFAQLANGVRAIHRAGKIHRDLKPDNVLVSADGHVTILDFGLVERVSEERSEELAGTPMYMAPEQLRPEGSCTASDWYAVGIMLHEALTGTTPFFGSANEVMQAKLAGLTPPMPVVSSELKDLAQLASDLVRFSPNDRPSDDEILARLGAEPRVAEASAHRVFVGRADDLSRLHAAYETTRNGTARTVWIEAPSGMGKSALIERFGEEIRSRGASSETLILSGRCYERESVPFKALDAIVDALSRHLRTLVPRVVERIKPLHAGDLCAVFPVLARVPTFVTEPKSAGDPEVTRRHAFLALKQLIATLVEDRPIIVTIDDLQWGDIDSGLALAYLTLPPDPPPVLVVGSYRIEDAERSPLLRALREQARHEGRNYVETLTLAPLAPSDAADLAREHGATDAGAALRIASESGGSPFFVTELARARSRHEGGELVGARVADLIAHRVAELSAEARALLEIVAIAGGPLLHDVALRAAGLATSRDDAIPLLRAAFLLRTSAAPETTLETYHDRIRENVLCSITRERATLHHLALARELVELSDPPADALAVHYREGGDRAQAKIWGLRAADRAYAASAFDRAARQYEEVRALVDEPSERARIEELLGDALANAGRGVAAGDAYLAAALHVGEPRRQELELRAAYELLASGELARGRGLADAAAANVGIRVPQHAIVQTAIGLRDLARLYLRRSRQAWNATTDERVASMIDVAHALTIAFMFVDTTRSFMLSMQGALWARRAGDERRYARALLGVVTGAASLLGPERRRVQSWLLEIDDVARRYDDPKLHGYAALARGLAYFGGGKWAAAYDALEDAKRHLLPLRLVAVERQSAAIMSAHALFQLGRLREFTDSILDMTREAEAHGQLSAQISEGFSRAAWLSLDDVEPRWQKSERERAGHELVDFHYGTGQILVLLYRGEHQRACELAETLYGVVRRTGLLATPLIRVPLLFFRGVSRATIGSPSSRDDAKRLRSIEYPGARAHAHAISACIALGKGDRTLAQSELERAIERYTSDEMLAYATSCRRALGNVRGTKELVGEADAFFRSEGVVAPERFAAMLVPGFS